MPVTDNSNPSDGVTPEGACSITSGDMFTRTWVVAVGVIGNKTGDNAMVGVVAELGTAVVDATSTSDDDGGVNTIRIG